MSIARIEAAAAPELASLRTPCLLLDEHRMLANIERLRRKLEPSGVLFRPHLKTAKSSEIARLLLRGANGPATVSTLSEAEYFARHGLRDLLYAVGLTQAKMERVIAMRAQGVDLSVVVDGIEMAREIAERSHRIGDRTPVLIEVDCGDHRSGVDPEDSALLIEIGQALARGGAELRGIMTHAGSSYNCRSVGEIEAIAESERRIAVQSAQILRSAGLACPVVSIGSTPTAFFATDLSAVTEVRAGVFVFFDLVMAGLGVCRIEEIALSVLATVIGTQPGKGRLIVDAGWMAMSRDRGTASQAVDQGYGVVCDPAGQPYPDLLMTEVNQEHGILGLRAGSQGQLPSLRVGDLVRILPNHACATAAQHDNYQVIGGTPARPRAIWQRVRGW